MTAKKSSKKKASAIPADDNTKQAVITPLDEIVIPSNFWNADNTGQFEEITVVEVDGVIAYEQESTFDEGTENERTVKSTYINGRKGKDTKAAKLSIKSLKEIRSAYKVTNFRQLMGKKLVAVVETFNGNPYISWKPKGSVA